MYACLGDASGRPFSSGDPCWDGFCALVDVRNSLVHFTEYSGVSSTTPPAGGGRDHLRVAIPSDIFALLSPRGLFLPGTKQIDDLGGEWFAKLRSPETEEWACKTASQMASGALDRAVFLRPPERKDLRHRFRM